MPSEKKRKKRPASVRDARPIYNEREPTGLSLAQEQARGNALHALSLMRTKGFSLTRAAREVELTPEAVRGWVGRSIAKPSGKIRYKAAEADKLVRMMKILDARGELIVPIYDSNTASTLGAYHNAVREALRGNVEALRPFVGRIIQSGNVGYRLLTRLDVLKRLASAGALPEYDIYGSRV